MGRLLDSSGAVIPGASIRAVNIETNVATAAVSNPEGNYELLNLNPGKYRITAESQGFKRFERGPVEVRIGDVLTINIPMEIGATSESVSVTADAPLLEAATASLGQVVDRRRIEDLPLPAGNPMYLTQLTSGTAAMTAPTHPWLPNAVDAISGTAAAGTRARSSEFQLDGIPNMTQQGQISFAPPPDMIQEVRVETAAFDASVGHFTGARVNMVIKSGTNDLHGNLFFSHVSRPLMARDFFTKRSIYDPTSGPVTKEKEDAFWPASRLNHYRGTFSGPVVLPGVYNGKNRTFFIYGLDVVDRLRNEQAFYTVPTAAEKAGDFSQLLGLGSQYQIYDPASIAPAANGRFSRQPLPGNIVPASRISPMAAKILGYYPAPNVAGTIDGRNNYSSAQPRSGPYYGHTARIDHVFSESNRFYGTYSKTATDVLSGQSFPNESRGTILNRRHNALALDDVLMLRPDLVVDVRGGLTRYSTFSRPISFGFDLAPLGFPTSLTSKLDSKITSFPQIVPDGFANLSADSGELNPTTYYNFSVQATHMRGNHSLRFGPELRTLRESSYTYGNVAPRLEFDQTWTRGPLDNSPVAPIGQGLASMLLGLPSGGYIDNNDSYAEQSGYLGLFLQDDWKVAPNLTVNLGLRYELELPTTERYNRTNRGFDFTAVSPIQAAALANYAKKPVPDIPVSQFQLRGGLLFAGANGGPRGLWDTDRNNFSPRIGIAYTVRPHTVIRTGYGIFFDSLGSDQNDVYQQGFNQRTSLVPSLDNGLTFSSTLANPFPDGFLAPQGAAGGLATYAGRSPAFFAPTRRTGYMQRWSFGVQQEVHGVLVEASYLGNRGTGLEVGENYNAVPAKYLSTSPIRDQKTIDYLTQAVANPFYGLREFAGSNLQGKTVQLSQLLKAYPQFAGVSSSSNTGFSWYHSLQAKVEKRFARGYTIMGSYTWSKFMEAIEKLNPTDAQPTHVISPQDRTHVLAITGIYELPFGKGHTFLNRGGWVDRIAGGWSFQGIYQAQTGGPINFGNVLFTGDIKNIPLPASQRSVDRWFNVDAGFERNPKAQLANNIRTFPLRLNGVRDDGYNNFNLSLFKMIRLRERVRLQLRAEAIDALNHAMFAGPNAVPQNSLFGMVNSVASNQQRQVFVGAKMSW